MSYVGKWSVEEPEVAKGIDGDEGLVMSKSGRTSMREDCGMELI